MAQLVYLWLEQFGCLKNQEFNFSSQFRFHYDNKKLDTRKLNEENTDLFFRIPENNNTKGKIQSVTAIIGDNGSGKTTLLDFLLSHLPHDSYGIQTQSMRDNQTFLDKYILIIKESNSPSLILYHNFKANIEYTGRNIIFMKQQILQKKLRYNQGAQDNEIYIPELKNTYFIKCSNTFCPINSNDKIYGNVFDLSLMGTMLKDWENEKYINKSSNDRIKAFHIEDLNRQVRFVFESNKPEESVSGLSIPNHLIVSFSQFQESDNMVQFTKNKTLKKYYDEIKEAIKKYKSILSVLFNRHNHCFNLWNTVFLSLLYERLLIHLEEDSIKKDLLQTLNQKLALLSSNINTEALSVDYNAELYLPSIFTIINNLKGNITYKVFKMWEDAANNYNYVTVNNPLEYFINIKKKGDTDFFKIFYAQYSKLNLYYPVFTFNWGLSSGEYHMLSLLARLYSIVNQNGDIYFSGQTGQTCVKEVILCLDEADLYFHPKWQQQYLYILSNFLKQYYSCNIQIILATHSPIMLSDIPVEQVIYMRNGEAHTRPVIKTFGANIYDLFSQAFFLDESKIGVIGKFAETCLETVNTQLQAMQTNSNPQQISKEHFDLNFCKLIIDSWGQEYLSDIYKEKLNEIEKKIAFSKEQHFAEDDQSTENIEIQLKDLYENMSQREREAFLSNIMKTLKKEQDEKN